MQHSGSAIWVRLLDAPDDEGFIIAENDQSNKCTI